MTHDRCPMLHAYFGEMRASRCAKRDGHDALHVREDGEGGAESEQDVWFLPDNEDCPACHGLVCDYVCACCGARSDKEGVRTLAGTKVGEP